ncbi:MAG: (2Fe-2S)-binding protein [Deltaproteobacteria bacterium]|nr:(2Fe-2S)-binding protein [Deltaproteobacteria bacterium]
MSKLPKIIIDGTEFEADEAVTVLQVIRANGIKIPTICYHEALKPIGACKLCGVEVRGRAGKPRVLLSCILKARDGLEVKTRSELVTSARKSAFRNLLAMAPQSKLIRDLAVEYGVDVGPAPDGCLRCRLCIRVCNEIVGAGALKREKRAGITFVVPREGLCIGCGTCSNICPTGAIRMTDEDGVRVISIRDEVIGVHALERCEACGQYFASQKFIKHVEMQTTKHAAVKEHHLYCHTCTKLFSGRILSASRLKRIG